MAVKNNYERMTKEQLIRELLSIKQAKTNLAVGYEQRQDDKFNLLAIVLETMTDGISVMDKNLNAVVFNAKFLELLDFPPDKFQLGDPFEKFIRHNAERGEYGKGDVGKLVRDRVSQAKQFKAHQIERTRPDGTVILIKRTPMPDGGFVTIYSDVSEQRRLEIVHQEKESQFQSVVNSSPAAITLKNLDGRYLLVNQAYADWMKTEPSELVGKMIHELFPPDQSKMIEAADKMIVETNEVSVTEAILSFRDGRTRNVVFHKAPIHSMDGSVVAISSVVLDITEQKLAEEQLRHSQRLDAVGQLTGGVAHDFNNLLGIMLGNAEFLLDSVGEDEEAKHSIESIKAAVKRGASLTSRLLAFSRKQPLSPVTTDVTTLVDGLHDMLHRTLGETIDLKVKVTSALWLATIDQYQFENALVNLALNARDAMPQGGKLTIETANVILDQTYAQQHEEVMPGDYVEVSVSDTGTGMSPEILEKVFEPFFTTKEVGKGSGLGLSMVFGFAKQSMGHITIYSEVGHGTTVKLYMPRSEENVAKEDSKADTREFALGSERILLVEDDESLREIPARILRKQGYAVVEAADGKEAIKHLQDGQPFNLLFTDVVLPGGMSGVEIAEEARRIQPGIKVLYTTGYSENAVVHNGQLSGVTLVNKPFRREELLEKIRETLDR